MDTNENGAGSSIPGMTLRPGLLRSAAAQWSAIILSAAA